MFRTQLATRGDTDDVSAWWKHGTVAAAAEQADYGGAIVETLDLGRDWTRPPFGPHQAVELGVRETATIVTGRDDRCRSGRDVA